MAKDVRELTRAEMDVMQVVWRKGAATVHGILEEMTEPKPAYNTVATVLKILEKKGFVVRRAVGRIHEFSPEVAREEYTEQVMNGVLGNFFGGSVVQMMSFFAQKENISTKDFDAIMEILAGAKGVSGTFSDAAVVTDDTSIKPKKARLWIR